MVFRTKCGKMYKSYSSDDGVSWSDPSSTPLENPNAKICMFRRSDTAGVILAYNPSRSKRTPLALSTTEDGVNWSRFATLEGELHDSFDYPTPIQVGHSVFTVYSADNHSAIKLAVTALPGVDAAPATPRQPEGPCDIFHRGGTPCVAAHSVVRALYGTYNGPLYQVKRLSDNTTEDIPTLTAGGVANSSVQDSFCDAAGCVIRRIYDQSTMENHLDVAPGGGHVHTGDRPCNATEERLTVGGAPVYAAYFHTAMG